MSDLTEWNEKRIIDEWDDLLDCPPANVIICDDRYHRRVLTVRNLGRVLAVVTSFVMWGPMGAAFSLGIILSTM